MFLLSEYFTSIRLLALLTLAFFLAACTTAREVQDCSPRERNRLAALIPVTGAKLERNRRQLIRLHMEAVKAQCASAVRSPRCERIAATLHRLQQENLLLEGRLKELMAVTAGQASSSFHVRFCTAAWQPERTIRRPAAKPATGRKMTQAKKRPVKKPAGIGRKAARPVHKVSVPVARPAVHEPAPPPAEPAVNLPVKAKPAAVPPPVRAYEAGSGIRVVGPSFLPDQSGPEGRPVPVHAPDR